jgi:hypothetical protein
MDVAASQVDSRSEDKHLSAPVSKLVEPNPYCTPRSRGLGRRAYGHTDLRASDKLITGETSNKLDEPATRAPIPPSSGFQLISVSESPKRIIVSWQRIAIAAPVRDCVVSVPDTSRSVWVDNVICLPATADADAHIHVVGCRRSGRPGQLTVATSKASGFNDVHRLNAIHQYTPVSPFEHQE